MLRLKSSTVGFKEWSLVCDALGGGAQSLILRKGGIAEGKGGFQWQCSEFLLFPTHFHEQAARVHWQPTPEVVAAMATPEVIEIRHAARLEWHQNITDWDVAARLAPFHVWNEEVIRERFGYGDVTGLSIAFCRIYQLPEPWRLEQRPAFGGCRSWLDLPERETGDLTPVLSDDEHAARDAALRALIE